MWIGVHEAMFELDPKVTLKMFKNWIYITENEEKSSFIDYILQRVDYKPDYYNKLLKTVESEFISDTSLLMPKVKLIIYLLILTLLFSILINCAIEIIGNSVLRYYIYVWQRLLMYQLQFVNKLSCGNFIFIFLQSYFTTYLNYTHALLSPCSYRSDQVRAGMGEGGPVLCIQCNNNA